jgi:hypothetical protein
LSTSIRDIDAVVEARAKFQEAVDKEINPIYKDLSNLIEMDGRLLRSLASVKRGQQLTIHEQGILQNILYGLISTQGDIILNLFKTLRTVKHAQYDAFERECMFAQEIVKSLADHVITPLAQETKGARQTAEKLRGQLRKLTNKKKMELKIPANVEKELKAWAQERERAKKASQQYTE